VLLKKVKVMNVGACSPHPDWMTCYPFKVLTSKPLTPTKSDSKIIDLGAYPTTLYYHCAGPIRKCPQPWGLPYYMYYHCVGPIRKCPQPWALPYYMYYHCEGCIRKCPRPWALPYYMYYPCARPIRAFGNALDLGPYPTTCTILVWDPFEGLEMPSTLGLTLLQALSLRRTH